MKNRLVILFMFALIAILIIGCSEDGEDTIIGDGDDNDGILFGFASMKPGSWVEYTSSSGERDRMEYIGTDTYNGTECYILEMELGQTIDQIWISKSKAETVLFLIKEEDLVMKMDTSQTPDISTEPGKVATTSKSIGKKDYTTPTGRKVEATIYKVQTSSGEAEEWISDEVPFYTVKSIFNGITTTELYDFGTSGAVRDISKQDAENALPFGFPF